MKLPYLIGLLCLSLNVSAQWSQLSEDIGHPNGSIKAFNVGDTAIYGSVEFGSSVMGIWFPYVFVLDKQTGVRRRLQSIMGTAPMPLPVEVYFFQHVGYMVCYDTISGYRPGIGQFIRQFKFFEYGSHRLLWEKVGTLEAPRISTLRKVGSHKDGSTWLINRLNKHTYKLNLLTGDTLSALSFDQLHRMWNIDSSVVLYDFEIYTIMEDRGDTALCLIHAYDTVQSINAHAGFYVNLLDLENHTNVRNKNVSVNQNLSQKNLRVSRDSLEVDYPNLLYKRHFYQWNFVEEKYNSHFVVDSLPLHPDTSTYNLWHDVHLLERGEYICYVESFKGPISHSIPDPIRRIRIRLYKNAKVLYETILTEDPGRARNPLYPHGLSLFPDGGLMINIPQYGGSRLYYIDTTGYHNLSLLPTFPNTLSSLRVYPNPIADYVQIESDQALSAYALYSSTGELIWQSSIPKGEPAYHQRLFTAELPKGVYLLQIQRGREVESVRLVK